MNSLTSFEKRSKLFWVMIGLVLIGGLGIFDYLTGYELAFSLFYLLPISLVAWFTGRWLGSLASVVSAFVWLFADLAAGNVYSNSFIFTWNTLIRLFFFVITVFLLSMLRKALEHERELARTDYLTGALNTRIFYDQVQMEIDRFQRFGRPFTLAYIDLDDFKAVNDQYGHSRGDQVLRTVVGTARKLLRKTDLFARLGGDEFALLLPETDQESARVAISKIHAGLLDEMRQNDLPVTFSIGVLTCTSGPHSTDELVGLIDELMYSVKRDSKNGIKYSTYTG